MLITKFFVWNCIAGFVLAAVLRPDDNQDNKTELAKLRFAGIVELGFIISYIITALVLGRF